MFLWVSFLLVGASLMGGNALWLQLHGSYLMLPQPIAATNQTTKRASYNPPKTNSVPAQCTVSAQCTVWAHLTQLGLGVPALLCSGGSGLPTHLDWIELGCPAQCRPPPGASRACGGMHGRRFFSQVCLRSFPRLSCRRSPESCESKRRPVGSLLLKGCPMGRTLTNMAECVWWRWGGPQWRVQSLAHSTNLQRDTYLPFGRWPRIWRRVGTFFTLSKNRRLKTGRDVKMLLGQPVLRVLVQRSREQVTGPVGSLGRTRLGLAPDLVHFETSGSNLQVSQWGTGQPLGGAAQKGLTLEKVTGLGAPAPTPTPTPLSTGPCSRQREPVRLWGAPKAGKKRPSSDPTSRASSLPTAWHNLRDVRVEEVEGEVRAFRPTDKVAALGPAGRMLLLQGNRRGAQETLRDNERAINNRFHAQLPDGKATPKRGRCPGMMREPRGSSSYGKTPLWLPHPKDRACLGLVCRPWRIANLFHGSGR
eukprot:5654930-Amphidinium_carterae.1